MLDPSRSAPRIDVWTRTLTAFSIRNYRLVLAVAVLLLAASIPYIAGLRIRGDFVELLPTESEVAHRFRAALARKGATASTLLVMVESSKPEQNERFVLSLEREVRALDKRLWGQVSHGPGEAREFYSKWRWLFAEVKDLERVECELGRMREKHFPGGLDLEDDCEPTPEPAPNDGTRVASAAPGDAAKQTVPKSPEDALKGMQRELEQRVAEADRYPTGFFRNPEGTVYSLMIRSPTAGMGEFRSDELMNAVQKIVDRLRVGEYRDVSVGFAGDIPNAIAEREALLDDISFVSLVSVGLILGAIVVYFATPAVLLHIGLAVILGCAAAFSAAMFAFGHLNAATSFLVAIIAGNGINGAIVYLARYRQNRRETALSVEEALGEAAVTCRKGTWLAALAAAGAFGSLSITSFRGFSEFGLIGAVGMISCWVATFILVPASVQALDGRKPVQSKSSTISLASRIRDGVASTVARASISHRRIVLGVFAVLVTAAVVRLPSYLSDPWEYNFSKLRSKSSSQRGAGHFSRKADQLFASRGSPQLILAQDMQSAPDLSRQVIERDQKLYGGRLVEKVQTIYDALGGTPPVVKEKITLLETVREHIDVLAPKMTDEQRKLVETWRPPEELRPLTVEDLPALVREPYVEADGTVGTPIYATLKPNISLSRGENLMQISALFEGLEQPNGETPPTASRAIVFAEMIHSMERDGPLATGAALLLVIAITVAVTRRLRPALTIIGTLLCGILLTVGGAAWFGLRLNFLNFVVLPLTFGICVEYGINIRERIQRTGSIREGLLSVGGAVFLCSLTTILGYGTLLTADNQALQSFGAYAIAGEFACLASAMFVLPSVMAGERGVSVR